MSTSLPILPQKSLPSQAELELLFECSLRGVMLTADCEKITHLLEDVELRSLNYGSVYIPHAFVRACSIEQLKKEEKIFKKNKAHPVFKSLAFLCATMPIDARSGEKIKLLHSWGYDFNISYDKIKTPLSSFNDIERFLLNSVGLTPLHAASSKQTIEALLSIGASTTAKSRIYESYRPLVAQGVRQIKTVKDKELHLEHVKDLPSYRSYREFIIDASLRQAAQRMYKIINAELALYGHELTPYAMAEALGFRQKAFLLKSYEPTNDIQQKEAAQLDHIKSLYDQQKPTARHLITEMKNRNEVLLKNLEEFKHMLTPQLLYKAIKENCVAYLDKIFINGWAPTPKDDSKELSYLYLAAEYNKPTVFKNLIAAGQTQSLGAVFDMLNEDLNQPWNKGNPAQALRGMPTTIIYYMADQGYRFDNQVLLEYVIKSEKEKLTQDLQTLPVSTDSISVKKFKL